MESDNTLGGVAGVGFDGELDLDVGKVEGVVVVVECEKCVMWVWVYIYNTIPNDQISILSNGGWIVWGYRLKTYGVWI